MKYASIALALVACAQGTDPNIGTSTESLTPALSIQGPVEVTSDAGIAVTAHGGMAVDMFGVDTDTPVLTLTGVAGGGNIPYTTEFTGGTMGMLSNSYISLNAGGGWPLGIGIGREDTYMLGINADISAGPAMVVEDKWGPLFRAYSDDVTKVAEWARDGTLWTGLQLKAVTPPTCDAAHAGTVAYQAGASGVADSVSMCLKDASDNYAWHALTVSP